MAEKTTEKPGTTEPKPSSDVKEEAKHEGLDILEKYGDLVIWSLFCINGT